MSGALTHDEAWRLLDDARVAVMKARINAERAGKPTLPHELRAMAMAMRDGRFWAALNFLKDQTRKAREEKAS